MRKVLISLSILSLLGLVLAPLLFWLGTIDLRANIIGLNIATVLWFATAPFWMEREDA